MRPSEATAPKINDPSMAISISQTATMVIFWNRVFFLRCIGKYPAFQLISTSLHTREVKFKLVEDVC